jgi:hypothetical protein
VHVGRVHHVPRTVCAEGPLEDRRREEREVLLA